MIDLNCWHPLYKIKCCFREVALFWTTCKISILMLQILKFSESKIVYTNSYRTTYAFFKHVINIFNFNFSKKKKKTR